MVAAIDWTTVILAVIGIVPGCLAAWFAYRIHGKIRTPSGDPIGRVVEQTHALTATNSAMLIDVHKATGNGGNGAPPAPEAA
jgi:hypothetical protein